MTNNEPTASIEKTLYVIYWSQDCCMWYMWFCHFSKGLMVSTTTRNWVVKFSMISPLLANFLMTILLGSMLVFYKVKETYEMNSASETCHFKNSQHKWSRKRGNRGGNVHRQRKLVRKNYFCVKVQRKYCTTLSGCLQTSNNTKTKMKTDIRLEMSGETWEINY